MCSCPDCTYAGSEPAYCEYCGEVADTSICAACQYQIECDMAYDDPEPEYCESCGEVSETSICAACQYQIECDTAEAAEPVCRLEP